MDPAYDCNHDQYPVAHLSWAMLALNIILLVPPSALVMHVLVAARRIACEESQCVLTRVVDAKRLDKEHTGSVSEPVER